MHTPKSVRRLSIGGFAAELWPRAPYEVLTSDAPSVLGFAFETQGGVDALGDRRAAPFRRPANSLSWLPRNCPVFSQSDRGGEYLAVHGLPSTMIGHPDAEQRLLNGIVDEDAVVAAFALRRLSISGSGDGEQALDVLAAVLLHVLSGAKAPSPWLTASRMTAIDRFIDAHLHERLGVARLARELELSVGHLVRSFRQGVGMTPHRYIMERRLSRARLLIAAHHPIALAAVDCGFSDQAHLTRSMRRAIGVTPGSRQFRCG